MLGSTDILRIFKNRKIILEKERERILKELDIIENFNPSTPNRMILSGQQEN